MKHLKTINELKSSTYRRAAYKLKKLGQSERSSKLLDYSTEVENREYLERLELNKKEFSKYGTFKVKVQSGDKSYLGDFYIVVIFDTVSFDQNIEYILEDNGGEINAFIGIIPVDEKGLQFSKENFDEASNGFFWAFILNIEFILEDGIILYKNIELENYELNTKVSLHDRASGGRLKNLLVKMLGYPDFSYPSPDNRYENTYKCLEAEIGSHLGTDYAFTMDGLVKYIKSISPNSLVKN